jgi:deoxyribodipyrimidine photo-lyase
MINLNRIKKLNTVSLKKGPVIYWMSRDQRIDDNWALLYAQKLARENDTYVIVFFNLVDSFLEAGYRQYEFMLRGLSELEKKARSLNIPFILHTGDSVKNVSNFVYEINAGALVTDFDPLRIKQDWQSRIKKNVNVAFYCVDAHNVVPCFYASNKQEFAAYTFRPKIHKVLSEFLTDFPQVQKQSNQKLIEEKSPDWKKVLNKLDIDRAIGTLRLKAGEKAASERFYEFLDKRLEGYNENRNDPNKKYTSELSPYLHFGHISAQRIAYEIVKNFPRSEDTDAFLEELIVRRELSDNFCYFNKNYDDLESMPQWALKTLREHEKDEREFLYSAEEFEKAKTHDDLWNAAQNQLSTEGKIHGYMRMYWAKKILEWTKKPQTALDIAIYLNDKYAIDGRDPNGYVGCAWSVAGVHDRAWQERPVFGKIRYMNYNGSKRKFDVKKYIAAYLPEKT